MARALGATVTLCLPVAGETGAVLCGILERAGFDLRTVEAAGDTALEIELSHGEQRHQLLTTPEAHLGRHELDDLYQLTLSAALDSRVVVITGTRDAETIDPEVFGRLVVDVGTTGATTVVDLSGDQLRAALAAGPDLLRVSQEEIDEIGLSACVPAEGRPLPARPSDQLGVGEVIVTRGDQSAYARIGGRWYAVSHPVLAVVEGRGGGDAMVGALAAELAGGATLMEATRLAAAAGATDMTRHGLSSGMATTIRRFAAEVAIDPLVATP
jgi:1-phosphofructokinase